MNKVFLIGNLTRDIELREGTMIIGRTAIAVKRRGSKDETDFFNLVIFGKTAETMAQYLGKGRRTAIEGHLRFSSYEGKDGVKKSSVDVIVDTFEFADGKKKADDEDTPF